MGNTFDYAVNITTYISYFSLGTDDVHHPSDQAQLSYRFNKRERNRNYTVIPFTNRRANGLKFISIYVHYQIE